MAWHVTNVSYIAVFHPNMFQLFIFLLSHLKPSSGYIHLL